VDGTLYDQRRLRLLMGLEWAAYAAAHGPAAVDVARSIMAFRRTREELRRLGRPQARLEDLQYVEEARQARTDEGRMREVVREWIFLRPLRHLRRCRRSGIEELLPALRGRGLEVGVVTPSSRTPKASRVPVESGRWPRRKSSTSATGPRSTRPEPPRLACPA
jgi:hypothetical protein